MRAKKGSHYIYQYAEPNAVEERTYKISMAVDTDPRFVSHKCSHSHASRMVCYWPVPEWLTDHKVRKALIRDGNEQIKVKDAGKEFIKFKYKTELRISTAIEIAIKGLLGENVEKIYPLDDYNKRFEQRKEPFEDLCYASLTFDGNIEKWKNYRFAFPACGGKAESIRAVYGIFKRFGWKIDPNNFVGFGEEKEVENAKYWIEIEAPELKDMKLEEIDNDKFLGRKENMKFEPDITISNPPYTGDKNSKHKLWVPFVKKIFDMTKDNGYCIIVSPTVWLGKGKDFKFMWKKEICYLDTTTSKYFKSVGSTFCSYIIKNKELHNNNFIEVKTNGEKEKMSQNELVFPNSDHFNKLVIGIGKKITSKKNKMDFNYGKVHSQRVEMKDKKSEEYNSEVVIGVNKDGFIIKYIRKCEVYNKNIGWKVCINRSGYPYPFVIDAPVGQYVPHIWCESENEAKNILSFVSSKLYYFFYQIAFKHSGFINGAMLKKLPYLDKTRKWTDEEIYKEFDLTKEEIVYVEKFVKTIK